MPLRLGRCKDQQPLLVDAVDQDGCTVRVIHVLVRIYTRRISDGQPARLQLVLKMEPPEQVGSFKAHASTWIKEDVAARTDIWNIRPANCT